MIALSVPLPHIGEQMSDPIAVSEGESVCLWSASDSLEA
jgi:hypothetical protein